MEVVYIRLIHGIVLGCLKGLHGRNVDVYQNEQKENHKRDPKSMNKSYICIGVLLALSMAVMVKSSIDR